MAYIIPEQARQRFIHKWAPGKLAAPSQNIISFDRAVGDKQLLYVINNETTGKSYLSPADDTLPVTIGEWDTIDGFDEMPENMRDWFSCYEAEIEWWQKNAVDSYNITEETVDASTFNSFFEDDVLDKNKYLISAKWEQGSPYTYTFDIPDQQGGGHWKNTGCNATAAAQILYFWGKKQGYYCGCEKIQPYQVWVNGKDQNGKTKSVALKININLPSVSNFDFANMVDVCTKNSNSKYKTAISNLNLYLAMAFESQIKAKRITTNSSGQVTSVVWDYEGSTGTTVDRSIEGWRDKFRINVQGYATKGDVPSNVTLADATKVWGSLNNSKTILGIVKNELDHGRPVMMGGYRHYIQNGVERQPGHMFICDGYNEEGKIHINWGNGNNSGSGWQNGWYAPTCLIPKAGEGQKDYDDPTSEAYYSHMKHVIVGIQPRYSKYNINEKTLVDVLNNIGKKKSQVQDFDAVDIDYDDVISINDAETLAGFILNDVDRTDASKKKAFKLASVVSINKSCREIIGKLNKLGY